MTPGKHEGIRDPWRTNSEPEAEGGTGVTGTPESDHPLDWDLAPDKSFLLRDPATPNWLSIHGTNTAEGAARILMHAVQHCTLLAEQLELYGFVQGPAKEIASRPGYGITDGKHTLMLKDAGDIRDGFRRLLQVLLYGSNTVPGFKEAIESFGLFPVLA